MNTATLLVEIGTEELPPKALQDLSEAFSAGIVQGLSRYRLSHGAVRSFATPRRLAVQVESLRLQGDDEALEVFGPPADRARGADGQWSAAAEGFARKHNTPVENLDVAETEKGPRLVFRTTVEGTRAADCLGAIVDESVAALPVPRRMRWGSARTEFVRPAHWLLMLLDDQPVKAKVLGMTASNTTRGHRFHSSGELVVDHADHYQDILRQARVVADFTERSALIREQVDTQARAIGAQAVIDEDLLSEVTALVEWPVALTGGFEERFLQVPPEALVSSMKEHQKYFHVVDADGKLLPHFITVANIDSAEPSQVIAGNERVIRPRLSDADFFFSSDKKRSLADRVEALGSIVFQQQLGTLQDKTNRLVALAGILAPDLGAESALAQRAALLSKADLLTAMVGEFADMQGIAGRYYARHDDEPGDVADAIEQHYWPRFAGDQLPRNPVATTVALADRLDTLVGIFGIGQVPTGSKDPFALRRASLGVLRILVEGHHALDLKQCLQWAADQYPDGLLEAGAVDSVMAYMLERFRAWYEDEAIPVEVFRAVSSRQLSVPLDIHQRVHAVHAFSQLPQAAALAAANKRVSNILSKQGSNLDAGEVSKDLLQDAAEVALANQVQVKEGVAGKLLAAGKYAEALASLADLQPAVDQFFDEVMVMTDDVALRDNRLRLLGSLRNLFLQVADISQLAAP